jgi:hypothetical protein
MWLKRVYQPKIVFLSEPRQNKNYVEGLRWRLGLKNIVMFKKKRKKGED